MLQFHHSRTTKFPSWKLNGKTSIKVATFGSSLADYGSCRSGNIADTSIADVPFGASGFQAFAFNSDKILLPLLIPNALMVFNGGIGGQTTAQMLARSSNSYSATRKAAEDVVASGADVILMRAGDINDITALTAASSQASIDAIVTRHCQLLDKLTAGKAVVLDAGLHGYSPGSGVAADIAFRRAALLYCNEKIGQYCSTKARAVYLNTFGLLHGPTGAYLTNVSLDGVHLSSQGQYLLARVEAQAINTLFGTGPMFAFPGTNLLSNADFSATSNAGFGPVANGYDIGCSNSTRQNAKVETLGSIKYQTVELVATSAAPSASFYLPVPALAADVTYGLEFDYFVRALADGADIPGNNFNCRIDATKNGAGRIIYDVLVASTAIALGKSFCGHVKFPPFKFDTAKTGMSEISMYVNFWGSSQTDFKIGLGNPRLVQLS